jgi:hypothetical protein
MTADTVEGEGMREKRGWYEKMRDWVYLHENQIQVGLIALPVITAWYISRGGNVMAVLIVCGMGLLALVVACGLKNRLVFEEEAAVVETRLFGIRINRRVYGYKDIYKFILAKNYGILPAKKYRLYADVADRMVLIKAERRYYDCIKIMEQIKGRAKKLIYDVTDEYYKSEDDMFRNYYKMKHLVEEVKKGEE